MRYRSWRFRFCFYAGSFVLVAWLLLTIDFYSLKTTNKDLIGSTNGILHRLTTDTPDDQRQSVIVLTYMRSGSSLLGDIIQQSPGTFYLYEPLHALGGIYTQLKTNLTFVNGTERMWPFNFLEEAVNIMRFWLKCDTTKVLTDGLRDAFMEINPNTGGFMQCYNTLLPLMGNDTRKVSMKCALKLKENCERANFLVIKTIRISMRRIKHLLKEFPELKIIHLIRDVRATLTSQSIFGQCSEGLGGYPGCSNRLCTRIENDILESEILQKIYPGRIKTVFYENIASDPIEASKDLYQFLGRQFTSNIKDYIFNITQAGKTDNCAICTTRQNSTLHIDSWRKKITETHLHIIEKRCNYILQSFNYTLYSNNTFSFYMVV